MDVNKQYIIDFIKYGSGAVGYENSKLCAIFSLLESVFLFIIYFTSNIFHTKTLALVFAVFLCLLSVTLLVYYKSIKNKTKTVLLTYINHSVFIVAFSLMALLFLLFFALNASNPILNIFICLLIYLTLTAINIFYIVWKVHNGKYSFYLKNGYKVNKKLIIFVVFFIVIGGVSIRLFAKYLDTNGIMILMQVALLILLYCYSFGYGNILKLYYMKKYDLLDITFS